jgi:predicted PurR-regulated permease PerM
MSNTYVNPNRIRQISFYVFLVFMFVFLFLQMRAFLPAFLGAITFYTLLRKYMEYLVYKRKWKKGLAAFLLLLISFLVVLLSVYFMINILSSRIGYAIRNSDAIVDAVNKNVQMLEAKFHIQLMNTNSAGISGTVGNTLKSILGATFNSLTSVLLMYFILYFMLINIRRLEKWLYHFIPLKHDNLAEVGTELSQLVVSNALGIPLVALLQGFVGLAAYLFLGVNDVWFWFVFTCISSMLPFVGAALAYVPLSIVLFANHQNWQGIFLLIYGFGVIGTVDNVFRFMLQKKMGDVHPLITVFGVIIGINLFGFIGLIFGPILISMFILLIKIYLNEFTEPRTPAKSQLEPGKTPS